jgi:hypothetical protein
MTVRNRPRNPGALCRRSSRRQTSPPAYPPGAESARSRGPGESVAAALADVLNPRLAGRVRPVSRYGSRKITTPPRLPRPGLDVDS